MYLWTQIIYFCSFRFLTRRSRFQMFRVKLATIGNLTKAAAASSLVNIQTKFFYALVCLFVKNAGLLSFQNSFFHWILSRIELNILKSVGGFLLSLISLPYYLVSSFSLSFFLYFPLWGLLSKLTSVLTYFSTFIIPGMGLGPHIPQRFHGFSFLRDLRANEGPSWRLVQVSHSRRRRVL